jgi:quercetin dioxygenase-like cupin family protein
VSPRLRRAPIAVVAIAVLVPAAAIGGYAAAAGTPAAPTRVELAGLKDPQGAKGETLRLSRVTIPPHTQLPVHYHPGTQLGYVERGTLSYTVRKGSVVVMTGQYGAGAKVVRRITAGQSGVVKAGQWVIEHPTDVHRGANRGDTKLVITLATLLTDGMPPAINVP